MANLFKLTKTTITGQKASVFMKSETIKTVRGLLQHRLDTIKKIVDFRPGDSITAELVEDITDNEMLSNQEIANALLSDMSAYRENIEDIIVEWLDYSNDDRIHWDAWFRGAEGKDLEDADNGKIYKK